MTALCAVALACAPTRLPAAEPLFSDNFDTDPHGRWRPAAAADAPNPWDAADGAAAKPCCRVSQKSATESPFFNVPAGCAYLRLTVATKSDQRGEWLLLLYGGGKLLGNALKYGGTYASGGKWIANEFYTRVPPGTTTACLRMSCGYGQAPLWFDDVVVTAVTGNDVLAGYDQQLQALPKFDFTPAPDRFRYIPKTMAKLRAGQEVRCQVIGHSYANDFFHSYFDLMTERLYPGAKLTLLPPIFANSATCWYWSQEDRIKQTLQGRTDFDLLFICSLWGEKSGEDLASEIRQIRAVSDCEILVTTGPTLWNRYANLPRNADGLRPTDLIRRQLVQAGTEEKVAIFNLGEVMDDCIAKAGQDLESFSRDGLHASESGRLLMAGIFARWFTPDVK
jgi:hypothetical protein